MQLNWRRIGEPCAFGDAQAMTVHGGVLFIVDDGVLYRMVGDGFERVGDAWWRTRLMVSAGQTLLSFESTGGLYEILPDGDWRGLPDAGDFMHAVATTALGDDVFVADGGAIYRLRPPFDAAEPITDWPARLLAAVGNVVVAVDGDRLWRALPDAVEVPVSLPPVHAITGWQKRVWAQAGDGFSVIHPLEGTVEALDIDGTWNTRLLAGGSDELYALEADGSLYALSPMRALSRPR